MKTPQKQEKYLPVFYTIWQDAWLAITKPRQYVKWARQPFLRSVKYLVILLIVISAVSTIYFFLNVRPYVEEFKIWVHDTVPPIVFTDNQLSVEDDKSFSFTDSDKFFFKVDPTIGLEDEPSIDTFYDFGVLVTRDAVFVRSEGKVDIVTYEEAGIGNFQFDGARLSEWMDRYLIKLGVVFVPLIVFAYLIIAKLIYTAFFAFLYYMFTGFKHDFTELWTMAIYALTPAILVGYLTFIIAPVAGLYTLAFVVYMSLATGHYRRLSASASFKAK